MEAIKEIKSLKPIMEPFDIIATNTATGERINPPPTNPTQAQETPKNPIPGTLEQPLFEVSSGVFIDPNIIKSVVDKINELNNEANKKNYHQIKVALNSIQIQVDSLQQLLANK